VSSGSGCEGLLSVVELSRYGSGNKESGDAADSLAQLAQLRAHHSGLMRLGLLMAVRGRMLGDSWHGRALHMMLSADAATRLIGSDHREGLCAIHARRSSNGVGVRHVKTHSHVHILAHTSCSKVCSTRSSEA
jgi:hypothetical protein